MKKLIITIQSLFSSVGMLALTLTLVRPTLAADWPQYRGTNGDSTVAAKNIPDQLPAGGLKELWKVPLGNSFGQIAVVGNKAVAFIKRDEGEVAIGLDAGTGKELWATPIDKTIKDKQGGDGPRTTPTIDGDHVYIYGTYKKLFCLDLASGHELWKHDVQATDGGKAPQWGNATSPVIVSDAVIVAGGGNGKGILAFDKKSGQTLWNSTDEILTHATPTVATIHGQLQVICFMQSGLVSVDPKNGAVLWTFAHRYSISTAASPVVGGKNGDVVYCSASYNIGAAACRVANDGGKWTATNLWSTEGKNPNHWSTPVCHNGYIYGLFGHNNGIKQNDNPLACLDIETGEVKWSQKGFGSQGGLILLGDKLLVHTPAGELVLVNADPAAYKELGRIKILDGKNWIMPAFSNGRIFARSTTEGICLQLTAK